jgi:DNA-binding GntR family transcriptional regulator
MPRKLLKRSLREQAKSAFKEMINSHRFLPGKRINVERIATELGVSRTPVWQALLELESEGLVKRVKGRGVVMAQMTADMAKDLYLVREPLEGLAASLAAKRITDCKIRRLESLLKEQKACILTKDLLKYSTTDFEFHAIIYEASGNWILIELLNNIKQRSRPFVCDISPLLKDLCSDHEMVIETFKAKNNELAYEIMCAHNRRMRQHIQSGTIIDAKKLQEGD